MSSKRNTERGFGDPEVPSVLSTTPSTPVAVGTPRKPEISTPGSPSSSSGGAPVFDVDVTREVGDPRLLESSWNALEIWTQNRIYALGADFKCVEIRDRRTGERDPDHTAIGARLVGGQLRDARGLIIEVSHPFPEVGSAAVFATDVGNRLRVSETSHVTRVLFRQRIVRVGPNGELPSWDGPAEPESMPQ